MWLPCQSASMTTSNSTIVLYYYSHHRDLHSFPTRRSSDLVNIDVFDQPGRRLASTHCGKFMHHVVDALLHRHLDRKSTRLNSSHRTISYAVFCLKKKI